MLQWWRGHVDGFLEQWFPTSCTRCGSLGGSPCSICIDQFVGAAPIPEIPPLKRVAALLRYDETSRPFIADLKYHDAWSVVRGLAPALSFLLEDTVGAQYREVVLTWAPTTPERARDRGFDQAEVLAKELAHRSGLPVRRLLRRLPGEHQTGRNRFERSQGVHFVATGPIPEIIVILDDVVTTGSTLAAAATVLCEAGALSVFGLALAATPDRSQT